MPCWSQASWKIWTNRTPALEQPAGQQAVVGERRLARLGAVQVEDVLRLAADVHRPPGAVVCIRKAISYELIRVAISGSPIASSRIWLSCADRVERVALEVVVDAARVGEVEHRVAAGAELHALVDGRQEAAAPVRIAAAGPLLAGAEDDEAGQVLRLAAQAVADPGPDARPAEDCEPVLIRIWPGAWLNASVIIDLDDRDVVDDRRQVRQQLGKLGARLAVPGELELRARAASSSG